MLSIFFHLTSVSNLQRFINKLLKQSLKRQSLHLEAVERTQQFPNYFFIAARSHVVLV